jgi:hypothetical protein
MLTGGSRRRGVQDPVAHVIGTLPDGVARLPRHRAEVMELSPTTQMRRSEPGRYLIKLIDPRTRG